MLFALTTAGDNFFASFVVPEVTWSDFHLTAGPVEKLIGGMSWLLNASEAVSRVVPKWCWQKAISPV